MIMVGCHETTAYRLYNHRNHYIAVNSDVIVYESVAWHWNKKEKCSKPVISMIFEEDQVNDVDVIGFMKLCMSHNL